MCRIQVTQRRLRRTTTLHTRRQQCSAYKGQHLDVLVSQQVLVSESWTLLIGEIENLRETMLKGATQMKLQVAVLSCRPTLLLSFNKAVVRDTFTTTLPKLRRGSIQNTVLFSCVSNGKITAYRAVKCVFLCTRKSKSVIILLVRC